jgi:hypothetical protein
VIRQPNIQNDTTTAGAIPVINNRIIESALKNLRTVSSSRTWLTSQINCVVLSLSVIVDPRISLIINCGDLQIIIMQTEATAWITVDLNLQIRGPTKGNRQTNNLWIAKNVVENIDSVWNIIAKFPTIATT